jgi:farnesyl diphosphate synthase
LSKQGMDMDQLDQLLQPYAERVDSDLRLWLIEPGTPGELAEAMSYCVLGGGKRLRPALVHRAAEALGDGQADELTRRAAVAVEMVHAYSLVHDDLPAMDDDAMRRGRPTAHVRFGEAMAILAGDALLTRAFGVLAEAADTRSAKLVDELTRAAGPAGMIAGQVADMDLCEVPSGLEGLRMIHSQKTAALIRAAVRMGAICAAAQGAALSSVSEYGESLGLAFQLTDDMLDATASAGDIGKTTGKDARLGKRTHVATVGLERARRLGRQLTDSALKAIEPLGASAAKLRLLAELLENRTH